MDCQKRFDALKVETSTDRISMNGYLHSPCIFEFPDHVDQIKARLEEISIEDKNDWAEAKDTDTARAYKLYLKKWPEGAHSFEAKTEIGKRSEYFRHFFTVKQPNGVATVRWPFLALLAGPMLLFLGTGFFLLMGIYCVAVSWVGLDPIWGLLPLALSAYLTGMLFDADSSEAVIAIPLIAVVTFATIMFWQWVGFGGSVRSYIEWAGIPI